MPQELNKFKKPLFVYFSTKRFSFSWGFYNVYYLFIMAYEIIIRLARKEDLKYRTELVRRGFSTHLWDAFWFFFLQELTLECCVLAAAVLFIFCGVSASGCLALIPTAAVVVALSILCTHQALAQKHAQSVNREVFGVVAEVKGVLMLSPDQSKPLHIQYMLNNEDANKQTLEYSQLVGTVSVSEYWGSESYGWLHAFAVHPEWRGRGVGRALAAGARELAIRRQLGALVAAASQLQGPARTTLQAAGFECRGAYERPLLGTALTLPLVRLGLDLPPV